LVWHQVIYDGHILFSACVHHLPLLNSANFEKNIPQGSVVTCPKVWLDL